MIIVTHISIYNENLKMSVVFSLHLVMIYSNWFVQNYTTQFINFIMHIDVLILQFGLSK